MLGNGSFLNSPWNTQVDDMRPPVSRQRRYCFTWNNYPLDAEEQYTSLLFADGGDMSLDGVDTPYYSIFES